MADKTVSQVQQSTSQTQQTAEEPRARTVAGDAWARMNETYASTTAPFVSQYKRMMDEQFGRISGLQAEFVRHETQGVDQALAAVDEMARLSKAGIQWYVTMTAQSRQMMMDAARRSTDFITPAV